MRKVIQNASTDVDSLSIKSSLRTWGRWNCGMAVVKYVGALGRVDESLFPLLLFPENR